MEVSMLALLKLENFRRKIHFNSIFFYFSVLHQQPNCQLQIHHWRETTEKINVTRPCMAQVVSRRPVTAVTPFRDRVNPCGILMNWLALGPVFLRVFRFSSFSIIPSFLSILSIILEMNNRPVRRHSLTPSTRTTTKVSKYNTRLRICWT
jgi:hypothetical protein